VGAFRDDAVNLRARMPELEQQASTPAPATAERDHLVDPVTCYRAGLVTAASRLSQCGHEKIQKRAYRRLCASCK
jgi:hypothetical protein